MRMDPGMEGGRDAETQEDDSPGYITYNDYW